MSLTYEQFKNVCCRLNKIIQNSSRVQQFGFLILEMSISEP